MPKSENIPLMLQTGANSSYNPDYSATSAPAPSQPQHQPPAAVMYNNIYPSAPHQVAAPQQVAPPQYYHPMLQQQGYAVAATPVVAAPATSKSNGCGCCSCLFALVALVVSIVAISLSGVSMGSLNSMYRGTVAYNFAVQNSRALHQIYNRQSVAGFSILGNGQLTVGYGYTTRAKGSIPLHSYIGFNSYDTVIAPLGPQEGAQNNHNAVIVRSFTQSGTTATKQLVATVVSASASNGFSRLYEYIYTPKTAKRARVLNVVNIGNGNTNGRIVILFEGDSHEIYAVSATAYSGGSLTWDNNEFLISTPKVSFAYVNATAIPIADNTFAMVSNGYSASNLRLTSTITVCQLNGNNMPGTCMTDSSARDCTRGQNILPFNGTVFFTMCDYTAYRYSVNMQQKSINSQAVSSSIYPSSATQTLGGFKQAPIDNSTFVSYFIDSYNNLKAVVGSINSNYYRGDYYSTSIDGNKVAYQVADSVNPAQAVRFVMVENYLGFFIYNNLKNEFIATPVSVVRNRNYAGLVVSQNTITLNSTGSLLVTPHALALPETSTIEAGLLVFSGLSEYEPSSSKPNNEYRYYQVHGSMQLVGVSGSGMSCSYRPYNDYLNCNTNLVSSGVYTVPYNYYDNLLYVGSEYYISNEGKLTMEPSSTFFGDVYTHAKVGVAISSNDLLVSINK